MKQSSLRLAVLALLAIVSGLFWDRRTHDEHIDTLQSRYIRDNILDIGAQTFSVLPLNHSSDTIVETNDTVLSDTPIVITKETDTDSIVPHIDDKDDGLLTGSAVIVDGSNEIPYDQSSIDPTTITDNTQSDTDDIVIDATQDDVSVAMDPETTDISAIASTESNTLARTLAVRKSRSTKLFAYGLADALGIQQGEYLLQDQGIYNTDTLLSVWDESPSPELYQAIIARMQSEHEYNDLLIFLEETIPQRDDRTPEIYLRAVLESEQIQTTDPTTIQNFVAILTNLYESQLISPFQYERFDLLVRMRDTDASTLVAQLDLVPDAALRADIQQVYDYYLSQPNVPSYFLDALVGMVLVQYDYFSHAEMLALQTLRTDIDYILPYQIFAWSHFRQRNRSTAHVYLDELTNRDTDQRQLYIFMQGVASYRQEDYALAITRLTQVTAPAYIIDSLRYLALAYDALDDIDSRNDVYRRLLNYTLQRSDYYTIFEQLLYRPWIDQGFASISVDEELVSDYIQTCRDNRIGADDRVVCSYGEAGLLITTGQIDQARDMLLEIYDQYPYSYIAHALGNYYTTQGETLTAMRYYFDAVRSTDSDLERRITRDKITDLATQNTNTP